MKVTIEMPSVSKCTATQCAYNSGQKCHAKAITVGDEQNPGCDTFFQVSGHSREVSRIAGVGACKISVCQYNSDYECAAQNIEVGVSKGSIQCLTFRQKSA